MAGIVSGLDAQKLALGADFSHYDGDVPLDYFQHLDFVWVKAADGDQLQAGQSTDIRNYVDAHFRANVQKAWDANIPCGVYVYIQPSMPNWKLSDIILQHYRALKAATAGLIAGKSYHAIALDIEETTNTNTNTADIVCGVADLVMKDPEYYPVLDRGVYIYSRANILESLPALRDRISNKDVLTKYKMWLAQWAWGASTANPSVNVTWEELRNVWMPRINMKVITPGFQGWDVLQWSNYFRVNGSKFVFDFNFWHGDKKACWEAFGYVPRGVVVVPPPVDPPTPPADSELAKRVTALETALAAMKDHTHSTGKPNA